MWWKRKTTAPKPTPTTPDLTVNLAWSDRNGYTQCSGEYSRISNALAFFDPAHSASSTPEAYQRYATLLRERNRLIAEGHTGKSFRFDRNLVDLKSTRGKIRISEGFFAVEWPVEALIELTPENPIGTPRTHRTDSE